jgi:hypothetical protein
LLKKEKASCLKLLEPKKVTPNAKSCSKVAEHNRDMPRQGFKKNKKKLAICLTSNFIADFYEIDHGDSKSVVGQKKFGTEVTWLVTSSVIYKKLLKKQNKVICEVKMT